MVLLGEVVMLILLCTYMYLRICFMFSSRSYYGFLGVTLGWVMVIIVTSSFLIPHPIKALQGLMIQHIGCGDSHMRAVTMDSLVLRFVLFVFLSTSTFFSCTNSLIAIRRESLCSSCWLFGPIFVALWCPFHFWDTPLLSSIFSY